MRKLRNFNTCDMLLCSKDGLRVFSEHYCRRKPIWKVQYKEFSKGEYSELKEIKLCTQHFNEFKKRERISIVNVENISKKDIM